MFWSKLAHTFFVFVFSIWSLTFFGQSLTVISTLKNYRERVVADSNYRMIELKNRIPNLVYDLKYATKNNFTKQKLYKSGTVTYLRLPAATALAVVQQQLNGLGYGIKIWDAYRPYAATKKMWELIKDERYVANPAKGSGHNRGLSVDLTLIHLNTGMELNMGTPFDHFTDTAHHTFTQLPEAVLKNRELLKSSMEKNGFKALQTEWWHYSWPNDKEYDVLDIDFKKLRKRNQ